MSVRAEEHGGGGEATRSVIPGVAGDGRSPAGRGPEDRVDHRLHARRSWPRSLLAPNARPVSRPTASCARATPSEGRPTPLHDLQARCSTSASGPPGASIKVDDTEVGIAEGINAGTWTVGVAVSGQCLRPVARPTPMALRAGRSSRRRRATGRGQARRGRRPLRDRQRGGPHADRRRGRGAAGARRAAVIPACRATRAGIPKRARAMSTARPCGPPGGLGLERRRRATLLDADERRLPAPVALDALPRRAIERAEGAWLTDVDGPPDPRLPRQQRPSARPRASAGRGRHQGRCSTGCRSARAASPTATAIALGGATCRQVAPGDPLEKVLFCAERRRGDRHGAEARPLRHRAPQDVVHVGQPSMAPTSIRSRSAARRSSGAASAR